MLWSEDAAQKVQPEGYQSNIQNDKVVERHKEGERRGIK
jgi:hypothetical protein